MWVAASGLTVLAASLLYHVLTSFIVVPPSDFHSLFAAVYGVKFRVHSNRLWLQLWVLLLSPILPLASGVSFEVHAHIPVQKEKTGLILAGHHKL